LSDEVRLAGSFALSLIAAAAFVPVAIRLAVRTGFLDVPIGYKGHSRATPYLGGLAVVAAIAVSVLAFGVVTSRYAPILIWGLVLFVVGTIDDKRTVNPLIRLMIEAVAGAALWHYGLGWSMFGNDALNLVLTILWTVGLVNAFNLMDNMDGAAASVAGVSSAGAAALAVVGGDTALAVMMLAVAGSCAGFLPYNLARPSRIFLGDGGSMPIGFVVAAGLMAVPATNNLGWFGLFAAAPVVGLPILDTALVVISRRRGGRPVIAGGRDHLTHRLGSLFGSPRLVAASLATAQSALCIGAVLLAQAGWEPVVLAATAYLVAACAAIYALETSTVLAPARSGEGGWPAHGAEPTGLVTLEPERVPSR
jgi:UDP-GlcNAc:undecaprenyl-phosphate GlcNAc-1-phosphate transferase